jgi:hypothetical protein
MKKTGIIVIISISLVFTVFLTIKVNNYTSKRIKISRNDFVDTLSIIYDGLLWTKVFFNNDTVG